MALIYPIPLGAALAQIKALSPSNDDILQRKTGAWTNRTPAQLLADQINTGAWSTTSPTATAGSGTFTSVSCSVRYLQIGKIVFISIKVSITTNGTAATFVVAPLPVNASTSNAQILVGRENLVTGKMLQAELGASSAVIRNYDNTYPGGDGYGLNLSGVYEAA